MIFAATLYAREHDPKYIPTPLTAVQGSSSTSFLLGGVQRTQLCPRISEMRAIFCRMMHRPAVLSKLFRLSMCTGREADNGIGSVGPVTTPSGATISFPKSRKNCVISQHVFDHKFTKTLCLFAKPTSCTPAPNDDRRRDPELRSLTLKCLGSSVLAACDEA